MQYLPPQSCSAAALNPDTPEDETGPTMAAPDALGESGEGSVPDAAPAGQAASVAASAEAFTHDARNLLTALGLYADLLNAPGVLSQPYRHYAGELRLLADRSVSLLDRVLEPQEICSAPASRSSEDKHAAGSEDEAAAVDGGHPESAAFLAWEARRLPASSRSEEPLCDPATVLRRFLPLLQAQAGGAAVVLRTPPGPHALPISGEALERITANLVCNAAQVMRAARVSVSDPPGTVWVSLQVRDGAARLSVEDSGPGISPSAVAALLEPPNEAPVAGGTRRGWGHRIVHGLVSETGGRLAVRPRPAGGTVITVHWPLATFSRARFLPDGVVALRPKVVVAC